MRTLRIAAVTGEDPTEALRGADTRLAEGDAIAALGGGVTGSLGLDAHGRCPASALPEIRLPDPPADAR